MLKRIQTKNHVQRPRVPEAHWTRGKGKQRLHAVLCDKNANRLRCGSIRGLREPSILRGVMMTVRSSRPFARSFGQLLRPDAEMNCSKDFTPRLRLWSTVRRGA